jgi:HTH-type transcriptional regulator / antitoxin HigA
MEIKPITTAANYRAALKEIDQLMSASANSPEGKRLDALTVMVKAYEDDHCHLDLPDSGPSRG